MAAAMTDVSAESSWHCSRSGGGGLGKCCFSSPLLSAAGGRWPTATSPAQYPLALRLPGARSLRPCRCGNTVDERRQPL